MDNRQESLGFWVRLRKDVSNANGRVLDRFIILAIEQKYRQRPVKDSGPLVKRTMILAIKWMSSAMVII